MQALRDVLGIIGICCRRVNLLLIASMLPRMYILRHSRFAVSLWLLLFVLVSISCFAQDGMDDSAVLSDDEFLDELYFGETVETATRSAMPIAQVAENVSVITAEDIAAMRAHTLPEVLERQAGVFVNYFSHDYLGATNIRLQRSERYHVLFLLDGVRLNLNSGGDVTAEFIPLGIIKRIEIIKGAASSSWGSALGGVVNIITKDTGSTEQATGSVQTSYGEANSYEVAGDVAGKYKNLGYYMYGGTLSSDGLKLDRYGERDTAYAKARVDFSSSSALTISAGYADPAYKALNWSDGWDIDGLDLYEDVDNTNIWGTIFFDTQLTSTASLHLGVQHFKSTYQDELRSLGLENGGPYGSFIYGQEWRDEATSFSSRLTWTSERVTANLGFEASHTEMVYSSDLGPYFGGPAPSEDPPISEDRHALYANFTYTNGNFSLTPGVRYDYHSNSEASISPSLGLTYRFTSNTLLRAQVARGFSAPYLAAAENGLDLKPEIIWTYQAGLESTALWGMHTKATFFYHNVKDAWDVNYVPWTNTGTRQLIGYELEVQSPRIYDVQATGNFTFVHIDRDYLGQVGEEDQTYTANLIISYTQQENDFRLELAGNYMWLDQWLDNEEPANGGFLWNLLVSKGFEVNEVAGEMYMKARNIFNKNRYFDYEYPNPGRWIEVGLAFQF